MPHLPPRPHMLQLSAQPMPPLQVNTLQATNHFCPPLLLPLQSHMEFPLQILLAWIAMTKHYQRMPPALSSTLSQARPPSMALPGLLTCLPDGPSIQRTSESFQPHQRSGMGALNHSRAHHQALVGPTHSLPTQPSLLRLLQ